MALTPSQSALARVTRHADALAIAGSLLLAAILVVATWGTWGDLAADTGYDLLAGARLAGGELPYRDYVYYYGPLAPFLLALFYVVGGVGLGSAVALGLLLAFGCIVATYALARLLRLSPLGAFLAAAITAPVVLGPRSFNFVQPHTYSAPTGLLAALVFLIGVTRYAGTGSRAWLAAAGACAGLVTLTRPELVGGTFGAGAAWLLLRAWLGKGSWREAALLIGPAVAIPALVYGAFATVVPPQRLLFENLYPVDMLKAAGNVILKGNAPLTVRSFIDIGVRAAFYAAGTVGLLVLAAALARPGLLRRVALVVAGIGAAGALAVVVLRPETVRYYLTIAYGWIPIGVVVLVVLLLWRVLRDRDAWDAAAQGELAASIVLAAFALKTYAIFFMYSHVPQIAAYAVPLVAIFLARLHLVHLSRTPAAYAVGAVWLAFLAVAGTGLTVKDARAESGAVAGPGGRMYVSPTDAPAYRDAISWILTRTAPKDPVLIGPQLTALYVLTDRRNPLPSLSLLPGALVNVAQERDAIRRLEASGVKLAIIDRQEFAIYGHSSFGVSFQRELAAWVHDHFERVATLGDGRAKSPTLDVWVRRMP
jgi:hypothetical protein